MQATTPITSYFKHLKKPQIDGLNRLGIHTILDLLYHFPARYEDAEESSIKGLTPGTLATLTGTIEKIAKRRTFGKKRMMIAEATILSQGRRIRAVWFNQPYIAHQYTENTMVQITGKISGGTKPYFTNPIIKKTTSTTQSSTTTKNILEEEPTEEQEEKKEKTLIAIYPETHGISSLWLSTNILRALNDLTTIDDPLPQKMRDDLNLPNRHDALYYTHQPKTHDEHKAARKRFIFEKTLAMQILQQKARHTRTESKAYALTIDIQKTETFMQKYFEFTPTPDQKKAVHDILTDIRRNKPMARLLEGDVGCGKTAVAAAVIHGVVTADETESPQVVYLAPTEVLAKQQFDVLTSLFAHLPITVALISGKTCLLRTPNSSEPETISKTQLKKDIAAGDITTVVGTHAIIQKDITLKRLALVIIDEQHRFGVSQRQSLISLTETHTPHLLSMTATPIPRTLALTIYGDLDISVIQEVPKERKTVKTQLVHSDKTYTVYQHIHKEVDKGHQAYVLCPRIEDTEDLALRSVNEEYDELVQNIFPDLTIGMLHGKMKQKEKQSVMKQFSDGDIQVLVCTTVVEVGLNVPNATIITILHAERFGLAQLHQLRGRVIRSNHQPHCYAVTDTKNEETLKRLKLFEKIHNGFTLAQKDLEMRGSGELAGLRQSGVPDLVMEGLKNKKLMEIAQETAKSIIDTDPALSQYPALHAYIQQESSHRE